MCTNILFFIYLTFIYGPFTSSLVFCLLCFKFCLQKEFFPVLSFAFSVLTFIFLLLSFVFKLLYIVFWLVLRQKVISVPLQILAADKHTYIQTDRQTDRQLIACQIWEGGGNRLIDRYVLHLMPSNF